MNVTKKFLELSIKEAVTVSLFLIAFFGVAKCSAAQDVNNTRLLSQPAISENHVAFVYDGDLWLADRNGENPHRLTSHEGSEVSPRFSPDGSQIAFSAEYDGNLDVYIVSVKGGSPKRLTYHPATDFVEGFSPDGKTVLFSSTRNVFTRRYRKLLTVSIDGGFPTQLPIPNGLRASYSADGKKIAYIPIAERFNQWKNYRGGTTSRIWIYDTSDHSVQQVRQSKDRCNDTDPVFVGNKVYFRSDRNGEFNLYSFDTSTEAIEQLTGHEDFPVNRLTECKDAIIYEQAGFLHVFSLSTNKSTQLKIGLVTDQIEKRSRYASGARWVRNAGISPTGKRAVFEFRGEIVTVPEKQGDVRNITRSAGVHERSPAWSPDGTKIAYFSDASGEYKLHIVKQNGDGKPEIYKVDGHGFYDNPKWSPDGTKISYCDNSWSLYVFDVAKKESIKICSEPQYGPTRFRGLSHNWSHDSKWLVYTQNTDALIQRVLVYDIDNRKSHPVTDGLSEVSEPVFDQSGKYLYFLASTDAGPVKHWFAMSNNDMELTNSIYIAVLQDDEANPLAPKSDEEEPAKKPANEKPDDEKKPEEKKPAKIKIDFDGIDQRIIALPVSPAIHSGLQAGNSGSIFFLRRDKDGDQSLQSFDLDKRKSTTLLENANGFKLSNDRKKMLYVSGSTWAIALAGKVTPGSGQLAVDRIQVKIDPTKEWQQIFDEVWRINRDYFYDPGMHGADWPKMKEKYRQFLPHCVTRSDLNRVLMWMCSEIAVGHHRVGGGDQRETTDRVPGGLLGADFEIVESRYRLKKVYGGLNWNGSMRAPLTEPGVRVKPGEFILAVDGVDLKSSDNIYKHFENRSGKTVKLKVGTKADGSDSRTVKVVPISSENSLRNRDWVENNLKKVEKATDGKVAYVYVPNTAGTGHSYFKRYFFPQADKQALIVDERFNGGGQVADYYIDIMRRPYISHWATRYGNDFATPTGAIFGPKVMIIDETAGSGGDLLPFMFNKLKLGKLVGKRTWGGLVGVLGFPVLMDGGSVTAPNVAIWTEDGFIVENVGVPPDVEVEQFPADVIAGRDPQLEKAIEIALEELKRNPPREHKRPAFPKRAR